MLKNDTAVLPKTTYLKDYKPSAYLIPEVYISIELHDGYSLVESKLQFIPNIKSTDTHLTSLHLNGEELELLSVEMNGKPLDSKDYELSTLGFTLFNPPATAFTLQFKNKIYPEKNTALEGLYKSGSIYCTQNEAEGFRKITYFLDRPDIMSTYTTKISAHKKDYPYLLSNGNPIKKGDLPEARHFVIWEDPFPKPAYLFALVAGNLGKISDTFTTFKGRKIALEIYCDPGNESKCQHAMESLKKSMLWDEKTFSLEYDLDIYMIVAVDAFNSGAMENKGLNVFNTRFVLASQESATDLEFQNIERVIGHEYFHNWTGNRITCRDWFQLTLKEGLTVFREQEFCADMTSRAVKRIEAVNDLRSRQFQEDASPLSHPIRPESYIEINNFYTSTVYEKGSEVIRMIHTLIGKENFRKGMDKYFELYDGQAVTTEDFIHAMHLASGYDFTKFTNWYHQAGTPEVNIKSHYDKAKKELTIECEQYCPDSFHQKNKKPFVIPLALGLLNSKGEDIFQETIHPYFPHSKILEFTENNQKFIFSDIQDFMALSINRGFSAPIKLKRNTTEEELSFLFAHDSDPFNRWEAGQELCVSLIKKLVSTYDQKKNWSLPESFIQSFFSTLKNKDLDSGFKGIALKMPSLAYLSNFYFPLPVEALCDAYDFIKKSLATHLCSELEKIYFEIQQKTNDHDLSFQASGERSLMNLCLKYLLSINENYGTLALEQFETSTNMSNQMEALNSLCFYDYKESKTALDLFYQKWKSDKLVMNKWLSAQAGSKSESTLKKIKEITKSSSFDKNTPNNVYSLLGVFGQNMYQFHNPSGEGYQFFADMVLELDSINPSVSARMATAFRAIHSLESNRQLLIKKELKRILEKKDIAKSTYEIVSKFLEN